MPDVICWDEWCDLLICVIRLFGLCDMTYWDVWCVTGWDVLCEWMICVTRLVGVCDTTCWCVWHDVLVRVAKLVEMCCATGSYVWHDSLVCVTRLVGVCDMTHSYVWCDSLNVLCDWLIRATRLVGVCNTTRWSVTHDSLTCVTRSVGIWDMAHWHMSRDCLRCVRRLTTMCEATRCCVWRHLWICIRVVWIVEICYTTHSTGSPAAKSGAFVIGDTIHEIDGQNVSCFALSFSFLVSFLVAGTICDNDGPNKILSLTQTCYRYTCIIYVCLNGTHVHACLCAHVCIYICIYIYIYSLHVYRMWYIDCACISCVPLMRMQTFMHTQTRMNDTDHLYIYIYI